MKFHEWPLLYTRCKNLSPPANSINEWYRNEHKRAPTDLDRLMCSGELNWIIAKRPYYNVWPSVFDSLTRLSLDMDSGLIKLPLPNLHVRFAAGHEPIEIDGRKAQSLMVSDCFVGNGAARGMTIWLHSAGDVPWMNYSFFPLTSGITIDEAISPDSPLKVFIRLVCTLCLLADDPDLIEPDVLADDRNDYELTGDQKYVERAHRRGKVGWNIGQHIEVSPHFRRAHFAIRWTEKGHSVPKIVPVKGAIVKRRAFAEVPTGYMDA